MAKVIGKPSNEYVAPAQVQLYTSYYFCSGVYSLIEPKFVDPLRKISKIYIDEAKKQKEFKLDKIYPIIQTDNMFADPRMSEFSTYIAEAAKQVLMSQGYNMENLQMVFTEMWTQEHQQYSGHEQHIHGFGSQISGFYFLDVPKDGPRVVFHDPRPAKEYASLPETNVNEATLASNMINYNPEPGLLIFTNSWLPHTIQRNPSKQPFRFIHFNLGVVNK